MSEIIKNKIMDFLTPKRMASVGNIATAIESSPEEIIPVMQEMDNANMIRLANSSCSSDCSSCSSCGSETSTTPAITDRTIAISLQKAEELE